jgi:hypothetical protein
MANSRSSTDAGKSSRPAPERQDDRRSPLRDDNVLSQIEDATYAILRKHEKKSA